MENVSESMTGRVSIIHMSPLSLSEINDKEELPFKIDIEENNNRLKKYKISIDE